MLTLADACLLTGIWFGDHAVSVVHRPGVRAVTGRFWCSGACDPRRVVFVFPPLRLLESIDAVDCMACIAEGFR